MAQCESLERELSRIARTRPGGQVSANASKSRVGDRRLAVPIRNAIFFIAILANNANFREREGETRWVVGRSYRKNREESEIRNPPSIQPHRQHHQCTSLHRFDALCFG